MEGVSQMKAVRIALVLLLVVVVAVTILAANGCGKPASLIPPGFPIAQGQELWQNKPDSGVLIRLVADATTPYCQRNGNYRAIVPVRLLIQTDSPVVDRWGSAGGHSFPLPQMLTLEEGNDRRVVWLDDWDDIKFGQTEIDPIVRDDIEWLDKNGQPVKPPPDPYFSEED